VKQKAHEGERAWQQHTQLNSMCASVRSFHDIKVLVWAADEITIFKKLCSKEHFDH
jgi:hypothetical protein